MSQWTISQQYREIVTLPDGTRLRLRAVQASDKQRFIDGFRQLSMQSRRQRCFAAKQALTASELSYLTEFDGVDHFAICVILLDAADNERESVGGARFIRLEPDANIAELAITVIDAWQGLGIGRRLLERLLVAAAERGVQQFRCHLLSDNMGMRRLLKQTCQEVDYRFDSTSVIAEFPITKTDDVLTLDEGHVTALNVIECCRLATVQALIVHTDWLTTVWHFWSRQPKRDHP